MSVGRSQFSCRGVVRRPGDSSNDLQRVADVLGFRAYGRSKELGDVQAGILARFSSRRGRTAPYRNRSVASRSCLLYASSANGKLPRMPRSTVETRGTEKPTEIGIADGFPGRKLDRRISVAPMMDWIDAAKPANKIRNLGAARRACLLYVSSRIALSVV
jgi:hypothetical protein